ncbi:zinc finger protein 250-like [Scomber scombrus]|uniref:zinc finger protein 250-like n=1 Tax=Scomber scombrus TaxID=13677 RepID=UPI002DD89A22|nr:zinc finger protein 250-like [Scomber scombrus]
MSQLEVAALTPEAIQKSLQSSGKGRSVLYIQAKVGCEEQTCVKEREHEHTAEMTQTSNDTMKHTSDPLSRVEINKEDARTQQMEAEDDDDDYYDYDYDNSDDDVGGRTFLDTSDLDDDHVDHDINMYQNPTKLDESATDAPPPSFICALDSEGEVDDDDDWKPDGRDEAQSSNTKTRHSLQLRVCLLKDMQISVLSKRAYKHRVQKLNCPRGLTEADFLDLLRFIFPELPEGDRPFDAFLTDKCKRLQPLRVKTLTPEEILRSIKSTGKGGSALYIQLKRKDEATNDTLSTSPALTGSDETRLQASSHNRRQHHMETEDGDDGEDGGLSEALSSEDLEAESKGDDDDEEDEEEDEVMVDDRDGDWKPDKSDEEQEEGEPELNSSKTTRKLPVKTKRSKQMRSTENSDAPLSCKVCTVLQRSTSMLVKHAWSHVDDPESVCGVCGEHSASAEELKSHLQSHQKTHSCDICGKSFINLSSLKEHTAGHTGQKTYQCDICHKAFHLKRKLTFHQHVHMEDKPFKCDFCPQSFCFQRQLKIHRRRHTGEKPYLCKVCGTSVSDFRALSRHMLIHTGEKRYSCQVCGKCFLSPEKVKEHEKIHTDRIKPHLCDVCCKSFPTAGQLNAHLQTHNKKMSHTCSECGKVMSTLGGLKRHMINHSGKKPYSCSECGQSFLFRNILIAHQKLHLGLKPFVCGVCGKKFARKHYLTVHMRTHNGERPYKCSLCDKAFTQSHCLKTHMKIHKEEKESAVDGLMLS